MSTYNGRHGPNVSQYLRELDTINPQDNTEENFNIDADLALFTNTQFFDFDSGQNTDFQAHPAKPEAEAAQSSPSGDVSAAASVIGDMPNLDFMQNEFNFPEFNNGYTAPPMNNYADANHNYQPLQPNHAAAHPHAHAQYHAGAPRAGEKRKSDAMPAPPAQSVTFEDVSRVAAEEDKRRRNTAASARFRIKKKQREQALEKSAKEMTDKVNSLESKVSQLETENKWLKNLLVEKNEGNEDISALWKEFTKQASTKLKTESSTGASGKTEDR